MANMYPKNISEYLPTDSERIVYSVPVDEYSYVKSIYDWLMGILVF